LGNLKSEANLENEVNLVNQQCNVTNMDLASW
jgi:hypothetical protein